MQADLLAQRVVEAVLDRKGLDAVTIDVRGKASYADYLVVVSGTSDRHVQAVAEHAAHTLHKQGVSILGREGLRQGLWALIDFGDVVLHVFHSLAREEFDLESLWRDAPRHRAAQDAPHQAPPLVAPGAAP